MQQKGILFSLLSTLAFSTASAEPTLKALRIVDDSSKLVLDGKIAQFEGVQFDGVNPKEGLTQELKNYFTEYELTKDGASSLCQTVATYYENDGDYRIGVSLPDQDTKNGYLQLVVGPEKLGHVQVKGSRNAEYLKEQVRLEPNELINQKTLAQDIAWMNSNPYRKVNVEYNPTNQPGVTDIDLVVNEKKNWKMGTGVENTGTNPIGTTRIFAQFDVNHFIFTDHTLKFKATTADHYDEYQSYSLNYAAPLPWRNTLKIMGKLSQSKPKRVGFPRRERQSYQSSIAYSIPQWFSNGWLDKIVYEAGYEFKGANSNVFFEDDAAPVNRQLANIGQFLGSLKASSTIADTKINAGLDLIAAPYRMLPHQEDADFDNLRTNASLRYAYSKLSLELDQKLTRGWKLKWKGRGQFTFSNLLPSEQFSLGGFSTVRGYQEYVVGGDNAVCTNLEISAPSFSPVGIFVPSIKDRLTVLGFVDAGYAWFNEEITNRPVYEGLAGVGPALRYDISSNFTSRLDVGFPLMSVAKDAADGPRIHFSASLSY